MSVSYKQIVLCKSSYNFIAILTVLYLLYFTIYHNLDWYIVSCDFGGCIFDHFPFSLSNSGDLDIIKSMPGDR